MNRRLIILVSVILFGIIVLLVVLDIRKNRTDARPDNPYGLNLDEFSLVDSALIQWREVLQMTLNDTEKRGIAFGMEKIWLIGDNYLQVISTEGEQLMKKELSGSPSCITIYHSDIYIGFTDHIRSYDYEGKEKLVWASPGDSTFLTSLAVKDSFLYAADAGKRRVLQYHTDGTLLAIFDGRREAGDIHGFIVPSPYFDLGIAPDGELWVVNPGNMALENYTPEGRLRGFWNKTGADINGFSGCCGPAQIAIMPDGSFVTAEKGLVRIKIHRASGELESVVAPPSLFVNSSHAPDLAVGSRGEIYALDFDSKMIRVFERKSK
jgi:hypothetical protein